MLPVVPLLEACKALFTRCSVGAVVAPLADCPGVLVAESAGGCPRDLPPDRFTLTVNEFDELELELYVGAAVTVVSYSPEPDEERER